MTTSRPVAFPANSAGDMPSVAPSESAVARRLSSGSTAISRAAPAMTEPRIALSPTAPQPMTATSSPGDTRALRRAAPTPVGTAQPSIAATGNGTSEGSRSSARAGSTVYSAKVAVFMPWCTCSPATDSRWFAVCARPARASALEVRLAHRYSSPRRQGAQLPQEGTHRTRT
jgi:hypothetical protein